MTRYLLLILSLTVKPGIMFAQSPFDGKFVLTEDDPGQAMVAVKRIDERTVEVTVKRGEAIAGSSR
jgi:hypothetical protein